ncbi:hypothetical protein ACWDF1_09845 [Streptomyces coelicoflavus]|uniref:hypothetical protein n=1 Tax=Streptomyces coelicoflavus TaxID=285562 RepID=UPI000D592389|nr:hypothetical protein [Streptomyces coelicoflavus]
MHPFDSDRALDVVRNIVFSPDPETGRSQGLSDHVVARRLAEHYGSWAYGWYNSVDEMPYSGMIIRELPRGGDLEQQALRYTSALIQWRAWLEALAALFAQFAPGPDADGEQIRRLRERAVAPIVTLVVERTGAGELWRAACWEALEWYLQSTGLPALEAEELAHDTVDAVFASWTAPDAEEVRRVGRAIGGYGA